MHRQHDDILTVIGSETPLKRVSSHRGGEYKGSCPFCGGTKRFRVQPEHNFWTCRDCNRHGDLIAYLVDSGRIDKSEAYRLRHGGSSAPVTGAVARTPLPVAPTAAEPPGELWQQRGREFASQSQRNLWSSPGVVALKWLLQRGLRREAIREAGLGYHTHDAYESRETWGLPSGNRIWLPEGITIPWYISNDLWRVNIRRLGDLGDGPKYIGPAGFQNGLYGADRLRYKKPAMLVEGELDALTIQQEAGDLVTACATGGASGSRRAKWIAKLAVCSLVLVTFDADDAGKEARRYWLDTLAKGKHWQPYWGDVNQMHQDGVDVRQWVQRGLDAAG